MDEADGPKLRVDVLIRLDCSLELLHGLIPPCDFDLFFMLICFKLISVLLSNEGDTRPHAFVEHAMRFLVNQDNVVTNGEPLGEEVVVNEVPICRVQIRGKHHGGTRKGKAATQNIIERRDTGRG